MNREKLTEGWMWRYSCLHCGRRFLRSEHGGGLQVWESEHEPDACAPNERLLGVVARLGAVLAQHGFVYQSGTKGISSGGSYANGFYCRRPIKIGLIVRSGGIGMPSYEFGEYGCAHDELIAKLGRQSESTVRFDPNRMSLETTDAGDLTDALVRDIEGIVLPTILNDPDAVEHAIKALHTARLASGRPQLS